MADRKGGGEAADYYNEQPQLQYQQQPQYAQQPPQQYNYQQPPPTYGMQYTGGAPEFQGADGKASFEQAFKIEKPKFHDLWAGILVSLVLSVLG